MEIAKRKLMYERDICKNPERYTWKKTYYTQLSVILNHPKRLQLGYFKFLLFPTSVERSGEGIETCTYEMIALVPARIGLRSLDATTTCSKVERMPAHS